MTDRIFLIVLTILGSAYAALVAALLYADVAAMDTSRLPSLFRDDALRSALILSLTTAVVSTTLAMLLAVPAAYLLARSRFAGRGVIEFLVDVPPTLPPTVIGLSLLLLLRTGVGREVSQIIPIAYEVPGIILAQATVGTAVAIRLLRSTFEQLSPRTELLARSLGASRWFAFRKVVLPEASRGIVAAATLTWAKALGEFGPVLIVAGITRGKTEVLSTAIYLELSVGRLESALAIALVLVLIAATVTAGVRRLAPAAAGS